MLIRRIIMLIVGLIISSPSSANEYEDLFKYFTNDNGSEFYVRIEDLPNSGQTDGRVWITMNSMRDPTITWREARILYAVNCFDQSFIMLAMKLKNKDGTYKDVSTNGVKEYFDPQDVASMPFRASCRRRR